MTASVDVDLDTDSTTAAVVDGRCVDVLELVIIRVLGSGFLAGNFLFGDLTSGICVVDEFVVLLNVVVGGVVEDVVIVVVVVVLRDGVVVVVGIVFEVVIGLVVVVEGTEVVVLEVVVVVVVVLLVVGVLGVVVEVVVAVLACFVVLESFFVVLGNSGSNVVETDSCELLPDVAMLLIGDSDIL